MNAVSSVPAIHNISTDTQDPPAFDTLVAVVEGANPLARRQRTGTATTAGHPWVQIKVPTNPGIVLNQAVSVLEDLGLRWSTCLRSRGSPMRRHNVLVWVYDDAVIEYAKTLVANSDVRSVSRVKFDLGVNAKRIGAILQIARQGGGFKTAHST